MSNSGSPPSQYQEDKGAQSAVIIIGVVIALLTAALIAIAVFLAANADNTAPSVVVVRDLLIIVMALEFIVVGVAVSVLLVQVARFINLINNEIQPLIESTADTVQAVRGTAAFLSKNLADPVIQFQSTVRGLAKIAGDVEAIRSAAGIIATAAAAGSPTSAKTDSPTPDARETTGTMKTDQHDSDDAGIQQTKKEE